MTDEELFETIEGKKIQLSRNGKVLPGWREYYFIPEYIKSGSSSVFGILYILETDKKHSVNSFTLRQTDYEWMALDDTLENNRYLF